MAVRGRRAGRSAMIRGSRRCLRSRAWSRTRSRATAQSALAPPDNHYFVSKGSWGQAYPDQWALQRIGFDASPQSAWRLVKQNAQPVIVAIIDTGLDWNHRGIDSDKLWRNPKEIPDNGIDDDKNGYVDDVIGWDFLKGDAKPWDHDGHGTLIAGIIAGDWNEPGRHGRDQSVRTADDPEGAEQFRP